MRSFKQRDQTDCGAACFAFVCEHYGLRLPIAQVRRHLGTSAAGTTASGLIQAAQQLGLSAKGLKGPPEALPTVPLPAIAHCRVSEVQFHYVVLVKWSAQGARVMDPAVGRIERWPPERFRAIWTGVVVLLVPGSSFQGGDRTVAVWRRWWEMLRPHRTIVGQAFVGAVVTTLLGLGMSVYVQKIVDHVIPDGNLRLLNLLGVAMIVVLVFRLALGWCQSLLSLRTAQRIDAALILGYYRHLLRLPQPFFDAMRVGEIVSRVGDAVKVRAFLNDSLLALLLNPLVLVFSLTAMCFWSWKLAALSLLLLPFNVALYWLTNRLNRELRRRVMERSADFEAQLVESLQVQPVVRRFRLEAQATTATENRLVRLLRESWKTGLAALGSTTSATLLSQAYLIGLLWLGTSLVLETELTPGQLMSCYTLAGYLTGASTALVGLNAAIQEAMIATDRLFELMDLEMEKDAGLMDFSPAQVGDLRCESLTYRPPGRAAILQAVSVLLPRGRITALAGESGCGKSTLLALLQRLYLPDAGRILVGDRDVLYYRLASWRRHVAVVPQHTQLLSGTLLENLTVGNLEADVPRLIELCREVGVLDFVERLPQGFLTPLTENGANLSGGQRQRLAIVRALYLDAPILLLDEPTSALDAESEKILLRVLMRRREQGCVVVVAAHSPALLQVADQVVMMAGGRIVAVHETSANPARAADPGMHARN